MNKQKVPVNLITGFLGVGKTTAIRRLLANKPAEQYWAVLVNEFGEVGIDGAAISSASAQLNVVEVPGGCICCTTSPMLRVSLTKLLRERRPDRLIIEPSGLGHPSGIIDVLRDPYLAAALDVRATITLVDPRQLNDTRYTSHEIWREQITLADVLIANKCDRADAAEVDHFLAMARGMYPPKLAVQTTSQGEFALGLLDLQGEIAAPDLRTASLSPSPAGRAVGVRARRQKVALPNEALAFARELRQASTDAEHLLWQLLRDRRLAGAKFRRRHPIPPYTVDFYCQEAKLAVELDGGQHNEPELQAKDAARSRFLAEHGITVLRYWNNEVLSQTESVLEQIYTELEQRLGERDQAALPHPQPFSQGEKGVEGPMIKDHTEPGQASRGWVWAPEVRFSAQQLAELFQRLHAHSALGLLPIQRAKGVFHTDHGWLLFNWVGNEASAVEIAWRRDSRAELIVSGDTPDWRGFESAMLACMLPPTPGASAQVN